MNPAASPLDVFDARAGIVCGTGAGGKKSILYWLATQHPGRVGITATTFTTVFPDELADATIVAPAGELMRAVQAACGKHDRIAFAQPGTKPGRLAGIPVPMISRLHAACRFDLTLVKSDGARMRWIKAPAADEPVIPPQAATVIPVVSARVFGQPLGDRIAHRPERVAAVTGAAPGEPIAAEHVARLLSHADGALRGTGDARVVPCINMADDANLLDQARAAAGRALAYTDRFDRVVIACLRDPRAPRLEVVARNRTG